MSGHVLAERLGHLVPLRPSAGDGAHLLLDFVGEGDGMGVPRSALLEGMRLVSLTELPLPRLAPIIHAEPALAARALQMANARKDVSAVPNLAQAVIRLGERGVRSLLLSAAISRVLHAPMWPDLARRAQTRAMAVAVGTEAVLRHVGVPAPYGSLAGAFHDLGHVLGHTIAAHHRDELPAAWFASPSVLHAAVDSIHAELGERVLARIGFAAPALAAVRWHHEPARATISGPLPWAVAAAVRLVDRMNIYPENQATTPEDPVYQRLALSPEVQLEVRREIWAELERLVMVRDRRASAVTVKSERRRTRGQKK